MGSTVIEVDDVQSISIRRGLADTEPCNYVDSLSSKEILEEQMHYPDLKPILLWLQDNFEPSMMELKLSSKATRYYWLSRSQLQLENGVLFYRWEVPISPRLLLVIPHSMKKQTRTFSLSTVIWSYGSDQDRDKFKRPVTVNCL